jgi:hypothetical protein
VTNKIRSVYGPLIKDGENGLVFGAIEGNLNQFWGFVFLEGSSEKGSTRKSTGNRVTRWRIMFWGNLGVSR